MSALNSHLDDDDRGSAVDQTVDKIRALIRERGLTVGDVLPSETELAAMFASSRNTVREAIRMLKAYGVVESRQKVGAVITDRRMAAVMDMFSFAIDLSGETFRDIQGFRRLIEVNLYERLEPTISIALLHQLETANNAMRKAEDPSEASRLDFVFHQTLIDAAHNRTLSEIYGIMKPMIRKVMETGKAQRRAINVTHEEHAAIIAALASRDRLAFAYHVSRHLDGGLEFIPAALGGKAKS